MTILSVLEGACKWILGQVYGSQLLHLDIQFRFDGTKTL